MRCCWQQIPSRLHFAGRHQQVSVLAAGRARAVPLLILQRLLGDLSLRLTLHLFSSSLQTATRQPCNQARTGPKEAIYSSACHCLSEERSWLAASSRPTAKSRLRSSWKSADRCCPSWVRERGRYIMSGGLGGASWRSGCCSAAGAVGALRRALPRLRLLCFCCADKLGTGFSLVKYDVGGNIDRLAACAATKPEAYQADVFAMVRDDVAAGTHTDNSSVTKGLLWLKRCVTCRRSWE